MRKFLIVGLLLLLSGLTALSFTRKDQTIETSFKETTVAEQDEVFSTVNTLATAD